MISRTEMRLRGGERTPNNVVERMHGSLDSLVAGWFHVYPALAANSNGAPVRIRLLDANLEVRQQTLATACVLSADLKQLHAFILAICHVQAMPRVHPKTRDPIELPDARPALPEPIK
jgi:hypothetical protein